MDALRDCEEGFLLRLEVDHEARFVEIDVWLPGGATARWIAFNESNDPVQFAFTGLCFKATMTTPDNSSCLGEIEGINPVPGGFSFEGDFGYFSVRASRFEQVIASEATR